MALTLVESDLFTPTAGGNQIYEVGATVGTYVGVANYAGLDGCTFNFRWAIDFGSFDFHTAWSSEDIAYTNADDVDAIVTPPMPVVRNAYFQVFLVSGTPVSDLQWDVYRL